MGVPVPDGLQDSGEAYRRSSPVEGSFPTAPLHQKTRLTIAGRSDRCWYCWHHCRCAASQKGSWHSADHFRQEQRCRKYTVTTSAQEHSNNYTREVLGSRTSTQASGVTSHRTATNQLTRLKSTGPRSMPKDRRSRTTGSQLPKSLMFTPNVASRQKSTQRNGTLKRPNGA